MSNNNPLITNDQLRDKYLRAVKSIDTFRL